MMKKVTKLQTKKLQKLDDTVNAAIKNIFDCAAIKNIFDCAPNTNTVFSECLKLADENLREVYKTAIYERSTFEEDLIADGRGWRDTFGHFYSY